MRILIIVCLVLAAIVVGFLIFGKVRVEIAFLKDDKENIFRVDIKYLFSKIKLIPKEKKKEKKRDKKPKEKKETSDKDFEYYKNKLELIKNIFDELSRDVVKLLLYLRDKLIVFDKIDFDYTFGLEDPMETGMLNGIAYGVVYNILGVVHNYSTIGECDINITPDFDNVCQRVSFNCIISLKNVHIIAVVIEVLRLYRKLKKIIKKMPIEKEKKSVKERK